MVKTKHMNRLPTPEEYEKLVSVLGNKYAEEYMERSRNAIKLRRFWESKKK